MGKKSDKKARTRLQQVFRTRSHYLFPRSDLCGFSVDFLHPPGGAFARDCQKFRCREESSICVFSKMIVNYIKVLSIVRKGATMKACTFFLHGFKTLLSSLPKSPFPIVCWWPCADITLKEFREEKTCRHRVIRARLEALFTSCISTSPFCCPRAGKQFLTGAVPNY